MAKTNKKNTTAVTSKGKAEKWPGSYSNWIVFLFPFILFANSIFNGYNLDDELVTINHRLTSKGISALPEIFTSPYYQDKAGYSFEYRPVVLASFAIEHQFFGDNVYISHLFNVLAYALCCFILFKILQLLFKKYSPLLALSITLLFAAHPAHTEVVCSIKNRDEILALLFGLSAFYVGTGAVKSSRIWLILPVLLLFALALMSKVTIVSFAFIIPLALILFCDAGIFYLLAITLALAVPAYALLPLGAGFERLMIVLLIIITMTIFYVLVHITSILNSFQVAISRLTSLIHGVFQTDLKNAAGKHIWNKRYLKRIIIATPFLILCILMTLYLNKKPNDSSTRFFQHPIATIKYISNQVNPKILSQEQNRPLSYLEECIGPNTPYSIKAGTSFEVLFHYLHKVVLPYPMSFYYGYSFIYPQTITDALPMISLVLHLILLLAAVLMLNKQPVLAFGIFTYLMSVIIFSNFIQTVPGMLADRFLLVPSLGWAIIVPATLLKLFKVKNEIVTNNWAALPAKAKYSFTGIFLFYSAISFSRNFDWKDDLRLFRHDIAYVNQSGQAHNLLGVHIMKAAQTVSDPFQKTEMEKEALFHFKKSEEIYPMFLNVIYDAGRVYASLNMTDSAIAEFKNCLVLDSTFHDVYLNLGDALATRNRFGEAKQAYESFIKASPDVYVGYDRLSHLYFKMNQYDESIKINIRATEKFPNLPEPFINLARTFIVKNQPDSARLYLNKANELSPGNAIIKQLFQKIAG